MEFVCPYCHGGGRLRHGRPDGVSSLRWMRMFGTGACPLCRGAGKVDRPVNSLVVDTGLLFIKSDDGTVIWVGCPFPNCREWIDCTRFFKARVEREEFRCPKRHVMTLGIEPTSFKVRAADGEFKREESL